MACWGKVAGDNASCLFQVYYARELLADLDKDLKDLRSVLL